MNSNTSRLTKDTTTPRYVRLGLDYNITKSQLLVEPGKNKTHIQIQHSSHTFANGPGNVTRRVPYATGGTDPFRQLVAHSSMQDDMQGIMTMAWADSHLMN